MTTDKAAAGWRFCAHADHDGDGAHWLKPGELCGQDTTAPEIAAAIAEDIATLAAMEQDRR